MQITQEDIAALTRLCDSGQMDAAQQYGQELLTAYPGAAVVPNILGCAHANQGRLNLAVENFQQSIAIDPCFAQAYCNLGRALAQMGRIDQAVDVLSHSASLAPDSFQVQFVLGTALVKQGRVQEGATRLRRAISINPNSALAHNNLGDALARLGRLDEALASFYQSLNLHPDASTYYNAHGLLLDAGDSLPAIRYLEAAVKLQPANVTYKFFLGMLLEYTGRSDAGYFSEVEQSGSKLEMAWLDAWNYLKSACKQMPKMVRAPIDAYRIGMEAAMPAGLVLEFGVRFGVSICQLAALAGQQVHGFDSFEGLPEDWHELPMGTYTTGAALPDVPDNVSLYKGWFKDTLPEFLRTHGDPVRFMNVDCDLYSSTKTVLDCLSARIGPGTVIVFDEYIGNGRWRDDEFKAFQEAVAAYGWNYEYLAFSMFTKQVVVRIL